MEAYVGMRNGRVMCTASCGDDADWRAVAQEMVMRWLGLGLQVELQQPVAVAVVGGSAPERVQRTRKRGKGRAAVAKAAPAAKAVQAIDGWMVGDKVYLEWQALTADEQVHLSQYRMMPGQVAQLRTKKGLQKRVGVRFNNDPVMWFRPTELAKTPEVPL